MTTRGRLMNRSVGRVVFARLVTGGVLNVLDWMGNQLLLGNMWTEALAPAPPNSGY